MRRRRRGVLLLLATLTVAPGTLAAASDRNRFPQPVLAGSLAGRVVQQPLESQPALGTARAAVRFPGGGIAILMDYGGLLARFGGVFGIGSRRIAVPLDAVALLGPQLEVVGLSVAQLDALPTYAGDGVALSPADTLHIGLIKPSH